MTDDFLRDNYVPNVFQKDIYSIDYDKLKSHGVKVISFDIDETIAGDNEKEPPKTAVTLIENLKRKGFKIYLLTNAGPARAKVFGDKLQCPYISNANKPLTRNFKNIINRAKIEPKQMVHIGNNQFDDVAGGNSTGIISCLILNKSGKEYSPNELKLRRELAKRKIWKEDKFYQINSRPKPMMESIDFGSLFNKRIQNAINQGLKKKSSFRISIFNKNKTQNTISVENKPDSFELIKPKLDALFNEFFEITKKPTIKLFLNNILDNDIDPNGRFKSKIGGNPYWPESMKDQYPKDMVLFAQINFAELPHLEGYPSKGILQFFTDGWLWLDKYSTQKTIYHPNIDMNSPQMKITTSTCNENDDEAPFSGVIYLKSSNLESMCMQMDNNSFDKVMIPLIKKYLDTDVKSIWDLPSDQYKYLSDKIYKYGWGHRIGGYPNFTQSDVTDDTYNTLLLQVDTDDNGIIWGDYGISNIFINNNALSRNDFNDIYYTWDCT